MSEQQTPALTLEDKISNRINQAVTSQTGLTTTGAMNFRSVEQIMEFGKLMAVAGVAIPKHLRASPGACLAVAIQASEWELSPFAVANKSYVVNDRIAYEAQLVNAVILRRAPIKGRFKITYRGEGQTRRCKVAAVLTDGETVEYESPEFKDIQPKNSPLWKNDPDQQLFYSSSRAMCRRHFPDVLLGVYTPDELADMLPEKEVTGRELPKIRVTEPVKLPPVTEHTEKQMREHLDKTRPASDPIAPHPKPPADEHRPKETPAPEPDNPTEEPASGPTPRERLAIMVDEAGFTVLQCLSALRKLKQIGANVGDYAGIPDPVVAACVADPATLISALKKSFPQ